MLVARRAGCLGAVGSLADWSGSRAFRRHAPLKSRRKRSGATVRVALSDTEADEDRHVEAATSMTVYVCITCKRASDPEDGVRPGLVLARETARAAQGSGVTVRQVKCLANCSRSLSAAIRRDGAWTYVFGGLDETRDAEALDRGRQTVCPRERRADAVARASRDFEARADRARAAHRFRRGGD